MARSDFTITLEANLYRIERDVDAALALVQAWIAIEQWLAAELARARVPSERAVRWRLSFEREAAAEAERFARAFPHWRAA